MSAHRILDDRYAGDLFKVAVFEGLLPHFCEVVWVGTVLTMLALALLLLRHWRRREHRGYGACPECGRVWWQEKEASGG